MPCGEQKFHSMESCLAAETSPLASRIFSPFNGKILGGQKKSILWKILGGRKKIHSMEKRLGSADRAAYIRWAFSRSSLLLFISLSLSTSTTSSSVGFR